VQGYLVSKAKTIEDFLHLLAEWQDEKTRPKLRQV
jgi:hypothetical protein